VQGTHGAALHPNLATDRSAVLIRKGFRPEIDSYSAFFENDRTTVTGLAGYLLERGIREVTLAGLATDFCVGHSALDAVRLGFGVRVVEDACRAIDLQGSLAAMLAELRGAGVEIVRSGEIG
jgi:nicotinamidase/pyrazinamidase